jgi:lysophospholipase L1-like esterase
LTIGNKRIEKILTERTWSVIHFNWGLWEIVCCNPPNQQTKGNRDKINGDVSVTLEEYEKNLEILVAQMKKTGAVLIWANTTFVPEGEPSRRFGDEVRYNAVAEKVMKKHGVLINDLHTLSKTFDPELFSQPKNVHYSNAGYSLLGKQITEFIRTALKKTI